MNDDYISRKAAVENFMQYTWYDEDGSPIDDSDKKRDILEDMFSDIPAANVRPVWISVKERLPETCTFVLTCFDDVQVIAFYGNYQWNEAFSNQVFYPTHWMPLPEFPKEAPE